MTRFSKLAAATVATATVGAAASDVDPLYQRFKQFQSDFEKQYNNADEENQRFTIFKENLARATVRHEASAGQTEHGVTQFMDLSPDEFRAQYLGGRMNPSTQQKQDAMAASGDFLFSMNQNTTARPSATVDWTGKLATPVKNQRQCGSCWAFSATEQIETALAMATGKTGSQMTELAPMQIVACDTKGKDEGCGGGFTEGAYDYVKSAGGIDTESAYPYPSFLIGVRSKVCHVKTGNFAAAVDSYTHVSQNGKSEDAMFAQIQKSPMSICINAGTWQTYTGGVMTAKACGDPSALDHCVQVVGYEKESDSWKVRNSWATSWGEQGFIRLQAGADTCGIAQDATTVTVSKKAAEDMVYV